MLACAYCYRELVLGGGETATVITAPCGHAFHEDCAMTCSIGRRGLECPECCTTCDGSATTAADAADDGKAWRTFLGTSSDGCSQATSGAAADEAAAAVGTRPPPPACWRLVARIERQGEELERSAKGSRQELAAEQAKVARTAAVEANLKREIAAVRRELDACRTRSMRHVVATESQACFGALIEAGGEPQVKERLRELQRAHGRALPELFAVQQQVLSKLQVSTLIDDECR